MKQLSGLKWSEGWNSQIGALKGCADYLGFEMSTGWIFGGMGAAFMLTMDEAGGGAGASWHQLPMMRLSGNLGLAVHGVFAWQKQEDFQLQKQMAWENTKDAIDRELPCYGYCLGVPEYYVVNGYTNQGYLFSGVGTDEHMDDTVVLPPDIEKLFSEYKDHYISIEDNELAERLKQLGRDHNIPLQGKLRLVKGGVNEIIDETDYIMKVLSPGFFEWEKLGEEHIGLLEMYWVEKMRVSDDQSIVREALLFALEYANAPKKWVNDGWVAGPSAYDHWIEILQSTEPNGFALSYSGQCWAESRHYAVQFLEEAAERLGGAVAEQLKAASIMYREVANQLGAVAELIPFNDRQKDYMQETTRLQAAVEHLRTAKSAELKGLQHLEEIVKTLQTRNP